jgi:hypothetical protein
VRTIKFRSKRGVFAFLVTWGLSFLILVAFFSKYMEEKEFGASLIIPLIICVLIVLFCILGWFGTYYVVTETEIKIYGGFILIQTVQVASIRSITCTYNPQSAHALVLRRLEILYGNDDLALISPENEEHFLQLIKEQNSTIMIDEKISFIKKS